MRTPVYEIKRKLWVERFLESFKSAFEARKSQRFLSLLEKKISGFYCLGIFEILLKLALLKKILPTNSQNETFLRFKSEVKKGKETISKFYI